MIDLPGEPGFDGLAFARGMLVITHPAANTVDIFDPLKRRLIAQVKDIQRPSGIVIDDRGGRAYVAESEARRIAVIGTTDWKVLETIPTTAAPYALALSPDGSKLFAANWRDQSLSVVDLQAGNRVRTTEVGGTPQALVYDPERKLVYVSLQDQNQIIAVDAQLSVLRRFKLVASQPTGLALDVAARRLYVAVRHAVVALQIESGAEVGRVAAPAGADTLWLDGASGTLYLASAGGYVDVIQTIGNLRALDEVHTEVRGHTLAFDPERQLVFMPGGREGKSKLLILKRVVPGQPSQPVTPPGTP